MAKNGLWYPQKIITGAFLLCVCVVGVPFWSIPYANVSLPNSFFGFGVAVVFAMAAFLAFRFRFAKGLVVAGLVLPTVLMLRVIVEVIMEPTRHNLWPLALVIAMVMGAAVAGAGAALGWLAARPFR